LEPVPRERPRIPPSARSYVLYGLFQERVIKHAFGGETFPSTFFLVLLNRIVAVAISAGTIVVSGAVKPPGPLAKPAPFGFGAPPQPPPQTSEPPPRPPPAPQASEGAEALAPGAPLHLFAATALVSTASTWCQYEALRALSFATQTIFKSLKITATMAMSTLVLGSAFSSEEYLQALGIGAGAALFVFFGQQAGGSMAGAGRGALVTGGTLMAGYVGLDALIPTLQKRIFSGRHLSAANQSLYFSLSAALICLAQLLSRGELEPSVAFVRRHPQALAMVLGLSAVSALGQQFIMLTIKHFGPVVFSTAMTTRQVVSIVLSSALFRQPLSPQQWASAGLVFASLYSKSLDAAGGLSALLHATRGGRGSRAPPSSKTAAAAAPAKSRGATPAKSRATTPAKSRGATPAKSRGATPSKSRATTPAKSRGATPSKSRATTPAKSPPRTATRTRSKRT